MTGAEALEAVAAGICGTDPCQNKCATCLRDAERALKAIGLPLDQAAALMSGEAEAVGIIPRPLDEWHEDMGPALWWFFPIQEPPWAGTPLDSDWANYYTHFTPIPKPASPASEKETP